MTKICPETKILNPITGRCVDKNGKIGKALLKSKPQNAKSIEKQSNKPKTEPLESPKTTIINKIKKLWLARKNILDRWQLEQSKYIENLKHTDKALITSYIHPLSTNIPVAMAGECIKDDVCVITEDERNKFETMMHIIKNAPPLPCDINVYRHTFADISKICKDNSGDKCIYHPYLASTTLVLQKAFEFKKHGDKEVDMEKYLDEEGELQYHVFNKQGAIYRMKLNKGHTCLLLGLLNPTSKQYLMKPPDGITWWGDQQYEILIGPFIATKQYSKNKNNKVIPFTIVKSHEEIVKHQTMIKIIRE